MRKQSSSPPPWGEGQTRLSRDGTSLAWRTWVRLWGSWVASGATSQAPLDFVQGPPAKLRSLSREQGCPTALHTLQLSRKPPTHPGFSGKGSKDCTLQPAGHPWAQSDGPSSWRHKQPSKKVAWCWSGLRPFPSTPHPWRAGHSSSSISSVAKLSSPSRVPPSSPHLKPVEHKPHSTPVPGVSPASGVHCRHTVFQRVAGR